MKQKYIKLTQENLNNQSDVKSVDKTSLTFFYYILIHFSVIISSLGL